MDSEASSHNVGIVGEACGQNHGKLKPNELMKHVAIRQFHDNFDNLTNWPN